MLSSANVAQLAAAAGVTRHPPSRTRSGVGATPPAGAWSSQFVSGGDGGGAVLRARTLAPRWGGASSTPAGKRPRFQQQKFNLMKINLLSTRTLVSELAPLTTRPRAAAQPTITCAADGRTPEREQLASAATSTTTRRWVLGAALLTVRRCKLTSA